MAQPQLLIAGAIHNFLGQWMDITSMYVGSGQGDSSTDGSTFSGPEGCVITDIYYIPRDVSFIDPNADVYIGWRVRYSSDGGASHTTLATVMADKDCPQIWDDTNNDTEDFAENMPIRAHAWYAAGAGGLVDNFFGHLVVPANVHVSVEIATVDDGSIVTIASQTLDSFDVMIYGHYKG